MRGFRLLLVCAWTAHAAPGASAQPGNWQFSRVADQTTQMPDAPGSFTALGAPAVDEGGISFWGRRFVNNTMVQQGIYHASSGVISSIANLSTPFPAPRQGTFDSFNTWVAAGGGRVGFTDFSGFGGWGGGVYTWNGGPVNRVTDRFDPVPGGGVQWGSFRGVSVDGGNTAYAAIPSVAGGQPWYVMASTGGAPFPLVRNSDPQPNNPGGTFNGFGPVTSISAGTVAFEGIGGGPVGQRGLYTVPLAGGTPTVVADRSTPVPGRPGVTFFSFNSEAEPIDIDHGNLAFIGNSLSGQGVYTTLGGELRRLFDSEMPIPGRPDTFTGFSSVSISGNAIAFVGNRTDYRALLIERAGLLQTVISRGQQLDGRTVGDLLIGNSALYNDTLVFHVVFTNGTQGVYSATYIPTPGAASVLALTSATVFARRRRSPA